MIDDDKRLFDVFRNLAIQESPNPVSTKYGAWSLSLSFTQTGWFLSAKLTDGSHSTEKDWQDLGEIAACLGAPRIVPSSVFQNPSAAHEWRWFE